MEPVCNGAFDYQWEGSSRETYNNIECSEICPLSAFGPFCDEPHDLVQRDGSDNSIFFSTHVRFLGGAPVNRSNKILYASYFTPFEDAYGVSLQYTYDLPSKFVQVPTNLWMGSGFSGSSVLDTTTLVLDSLNQVRRRIAPHTSGISLTVPEILELAGISHQLDSPQPLLGRNTLANATIQSGPVGRLTGLIVDLLVSCFSRNAVPHSLNIEGVKGRLCTLSVQPAPPQWVMQNNLGVNHSHGSVRTYGLRIRARTAGHVQTWHIPSAFIFVVKAVIVLSLPREICQFIATRCLGPLSRFYKGLVLQHASLANYATEMVMKLVSADIAYEWVTDDAEDVSVERLRQVITRSLRGCRNFGDEEISKIVELAFLTAMGIRENTSISRSTTRLPMPPNSSECKVMSKQEFIHAACNSSEADMDDVIKLFAHRRASNWFQQAFVPGLPINLDDDVFECTDPTTAEGSNTVCAMPAQDRQDGIHSACSSSASSITSETLDDTKQGSRNADILARLEYLEHTLENGSLKKQADDHNMLAALLSRVEKLEDFASKITEMNIPAACQEQLLQPTGRQSHDITSSSVKLEDTLLQTRLIYQKEMAFELGPESNSNCSSDTSTGLLQYPVAKDQAVDAVRPLQHSACIDRLVGSTPQSKLWLQEPAVALLKQPFSEASRMLPVPPCPEPPSGNENLALYR